MTMKQAKFIILGLLSVCCLGNNVQAAGLDEIYRDLVRSDNRGYLPLFVKNRQVPKVFTDDISSNDVSVPLLIDEQTLKGLEDINLKNERQRLSAEREAAELHWQNVLKNVQQGYVTSIELDELYKREHDNNPHAVEILGWIYARGIGVKPDLIKSFNFYKKGANLGIKQARENAVKVYRAMSATQKTKLLE